MSPLHQPRYATRRIPSGFELPTRACGKALEIVVILVVHIVF